MNRCASVLLGVLGFAMAGFAQDTPSFETFLGFTYTRANPGPTTFPSFSAYGGSAQFAVNFGGWLGFATDVGAVYNSKIAGTNSDATIANFLVGPRISIRTPRVTPYLQVLLGGANIWASQTFTNGRAPAYERISETGFAMTAGGGMDLKINKHVSFRMFQLEYFLTRFQNPRTANTNNQNNLRYSTGFNFTFGAQ